MKSFWLTPSAEVLPVDHHWRKAQEIAGQSEDPTELLLTKGYLRCNIVDSILFFERRMKPSEKQMAELLSFAIEHQLRLHDHFGKLIHE